MQEMRYLGWEEVIGKPGIDEIAASSDRQGNFPPIKQSRGNLPQGGGYPQELTNSNILARQHQCIVKISLGMWSIPSKMES